MANSSSSLFSTNILLPHLLLQATATPRERIRCPTEQLWCQMASEAVTGSLLTKTTGTLIWLSFILSVIQCKAAYHVFWRKRVEKKSKQHYYDLLPGQMLCCEYAHTAGTKITRIWITTDFIIFIPHFQKSKKFHTHSSSRFIWKQNSTHRKESTVT